MLPLNKSMTYRDCQYMYMYIFTIRTMAIMTLNWTCKKTFLPANNIKNISIQLKVLHFCFQKTRCIGLQSQVTLLEQSIQLKLLSCFKLQDYKSCNLDSKSFRILCEVWEEDFAQLNYTVLWPLSFFSILNYVSLTI